MSGKLKQKFDEKLDSFVMCPRAITDDYRAGKLTPNEYFVHSYLRHLGNPFGITHTSLENIVKDVFQEKITPNSTNKANKIVLALRKKKYIYYPTRTGRKGSFKIHFGDWKLPDKSIKSLDQYFNTEGKQASTPTSGQRSAEVPQSSPASMQTLVTMKAQANIGAGSISKNSQGRTAYNDNDKDTHTYIPIDSKTSKKELDSPTYKHRFPIGDFNPKNREEAQCKDIGLGLGEAHMDFLLVVLEKHGLGIIERAYGILKEKAEEIRFKNRPAYFNKIVEQLILEQ